MVSVAGWLAVGQIVAGTGVEPAEGTEWTPADQGVAPAEGTEGAPPAEGPAPAEGPPAEGAQDPPAEGAPATEGAEGTEGVAADGTGASGAQGAASEADAPVEPAPLPSRPPAPPADAEPRAWGGAHHTPLPAPPPPADASTLASGPWRGRFWLGVGLHASFPLGGRPPARGGVISAVGEVTFGWRLHRFLALHTAVSTYAHDAARATVLTADGGEAEEIVFGRITAFDLLTARVFLPLPRRIEPWAELGAGVGVRRDPLGLERAQAAGLIRVGAGVDFWLAPSFTVGLSTAYRTTLIGDSVGHGLRAGADLGIHW